MTGHLTFVKTYFERAISPPNIKRFWQTPACKNYRKALLPL